MTEATLSRRLVAEAVGTAFLLAAVVGSGIMAERLAGGNAGLALLGNTVATGAILAVLILIFGPVSGAHFNPAVTLAFVLRRDIAGRVAVAYVLVQLAAAAIGTVVAHIMFGEPWLTASTNQRTGAGQWLGELVASFGLVATILGCVRFRPEATAYAVGLFITAGYWFTSSTSFANPAVTVARTLTDSFSGIAPAHAPAFIVCQLVGATAATLLFGWLLAPKTGDDSAASVVRQAHHEPEGEAVRPEPVEGRP